MSESVKAQIYAGFIGPDFTNPNTKWYTSKALRKGLTAYNDILLKTCDEHHLNCIDAASKIPHEAPYFYDDFHFSEFGARTLAKVISEEVGRTLQSCEKKN